MNKQKIYYCYALSEEQLEYLRNKKYKIDRMECFFSLMPLVERVSKLVPISKTQQIELMPGQFMIDNTQLANLWDRDRKTVPKLLMAMEELGIFSSQKVKDEHRIHTIHSLTGWYVDGQFVHNPYGLKQGLDNKLIHAEVAPARVITISEPIAPNTDEPVSNFEKVITPETIVPPDLPPSSLVSLPSLQSNDVGNVVASETEVKTSAPPSNNISPQSGSDRNSAGSPLSQSGAVANPNVGGQNQRPPQQPPSQPNGFQRPPFISSSGNPPGSNGLNNPNGSQNPQR